MNLPLPELPEELRFEVAGAVATITLNRPAKLNTMTPAMGKALVELVYYVNNTSDGSQLFLPFYAFYELTIHDI